jgi:hypothetical protein
MILQGQRVSFSGDVYISRPEYIPLVVKKRHTCFFWAFGSPSSGLVSAMLDVVSKEDFTTKFLEVV